MSKNKKNFLLFSLFYLALFGFAFLFFGGTKVFAYSSGANCGARAEVDYPSGSSPSGGTGTFCASGWARNVYENGKYTIHYLLDLPTPYPRASNSTIWPYGWHWTCTKSGSTTQNCYAQQCGSRDLVGVCTSNCGGGAGGPGCGDVYVGSVVDSYYNASAGETQIADTTAIDTASERCYTANGGTTDGGILQGYWDDISGVSDSYYHWSCDGPSHTSGSTTYHHNTGFAVKKRLNAAVGPRPPQLGGTAQKTNTATTACYPSNLTEPSTAGHTAVAPLLPQVISTSEDSNYYYWTCSGQHGGNNASGQVAKTYTITPSVDTGCSISPNTTQTVNGGSSSGFTFSAQAGYTLSGYSVDSGATVSGSGYTFLSVAAGHTIRSKCTANPLPTCSLSPSPASISAGGSSTISWTTTNGTSLTINGVSKTPVASGSMSTGALASTTTYTGSVTGPGGSGSCSTTVNVVPAPTCSLTANPSSILEGNSSTLSWTTTNAVDFRVNGTMKSLPSGSESTGALAATTVYNGVVRNSAGGTANCSTTVTVSPRCSITSFTATTTPGSGDVTPFTAGSPVNNLYFYAKGSRVNSYRVWLGKTSPTATPADPADISLVNGTLNTVTNTAVGSNTNFTSPAKILTQYNAYIYGYTGANYVAPQCIASIPITIQGATCSINTATIAPTTPGDSNIISLSPFRSYAPINVTLSGTSTNSFPNPMVFMWDFDKAVSTSDDSFSYPTISKTHTYDNPNFPFQSITASLSGKLDNGYVCDNSRDVTLELYPPPGMNCKVYPGSGSSPLVIKVDYALTGINGSLPYSIKINKGDGTADTTLTSLSEIYYYTYKLASGTSSASYIIKMTASGTDMSGGAKTYNDIECGSSPVKVQNPKSGDRGGERAP